MSPIAEKFLPRVTQWGKMLGTTVMNFSYLKNSLKNSSFPSDDREMRQSQESQLPTLLKASRAITPQLQWGLCSSTEPYTLSNLARPCQTLT